MRTAFFLLALVASPVAAQQERHQAPKQTSEARKVRFNNRLLEGADLATLERLERSIGRLDDGAYWYDPRTGAAGRWGGPTLGFLPPGLTLGGPLPADASGGGQGMLTGVFINGRELHPIDVAGLQQLLGQVMPGRWWVDAQGNYGLEGGPPLGNLVLLAQSRRSSGSGGGAWSKRYEGAGGPRDTMNMASDGTNTCFNVAGRADCISR